MSKEDAVRITIEWCDAEISPMVWYEPVVYVTKSGKMGVFKDTVSWTGGDPKKTELHRSNWEWLREKYNIAYWAYQKDVIPKQI